MPTDSQHGNEYDRGVVRPATHAQDVDSRNIRRKIKATVSASNNLQNLDSLARVNQVSLREITRISQKDHPESGARLAFEALLYFGRELGDTLERRNQGSNLPAGIISRYIEKIQRLSKVLSNLDRIDSARIPFELIPALNWVASDIVPAFSSPPAHLFIRLCDKGSYSIATLSDLLGQANRNDPWKREWETKKDGQNVAECVIIGAPSAEARSVLIHALSAHEFAHLVICDSEERFSLHAHASKVVDDFNTHNTARCESDRAILFSTGGATKDEGQVSFTRHGWVSEIFSDMAAAQLLGPAFLVTARRTYLGLNGGSSVSHPSRLLRLKAIKHFLTSKYPDVWSMDVFRSIVNDAESEIDSPSTPLTGDVERYEQIVEQLFPEIASCVQRAIEQKPLAHSQYEKLINSAVAEFAELSPPMTIFGSTAMDSGSASFWMILTAGLCFRENKKAFDAWNIRYKWPKKNGDSLDLAGESRLDSILLHSLRSAEIRWRFCKTNKVAT